MVDVDHDLIVERCGIGDTRCWRGVCGCGWISPLCDSPSYAAAEWEVHTFRVLVPDVSTEIEAMRARRRRGTA